MGYDGEASRREEIIRILGFEGSVSLDEAYE